MAARWSLATSIPLGNYAQPMKKLAIGVTLAAIVLVAVIVESDPEFRRGSSLQVPPRW